MQIDASLVERLLYEEESHELDFKEEQYRFAGATDEEKSELLKDVLAFANGWRRADAFILLGVREVKGGPSIVVGISQDLDDAQIQQFVNSKTQRPVTFSYRALQVRQERVGVIHIPVQTRPVFLKKDFGKLKKGAVYLRRGTSTDIADPDEIARMGSDAIASAGIEPRLHLSMGKSATREIVGTSLNVDSISLITPNESEIPDFRNDRGDRFGIDIAALHANRNYYRELVEYVRVTELVEGFRIVVQNSGDVVAQGVRVVFEIEDSESVLSILDADDLPSRPSSNWSHIQVPMLVRPEDRSDIMVERFGTTWRIVVDLGKIRPKDTVWSKSELFIGATEDIALVFPAKIFADNLSSPSLAEIQGQISVTKEKADLTKIIDIEGERFMRSDEYRRLIGSEGDEE